MSDTPPPDAILSVTVAPLAVLALVLLMQVAPAALDTLARALDTAPPVPARPLPFVWLGLYADRVFAGAAGGYIHMLRTARPETPGGTVRIRTWAQQVVAGALMGNYLPIIIGHLHPVFADLPDAANIGLAFALGYAGYAVLTLFERRAEAAAPSGGLPGGSPPASP